MTEKSKEPCWYVVHTYSGYENKVKDTLEKSVENNGMQNLIFDVVVPHHCPLSDEEVKEAIAGKAKALEGGPFYTVVSLDRSYI